jgi:hypothetical protein
MISGYIRLEDVAIDFDLDDNLMAHYTVFDMVTNDYEEFVVPQSKFLKALAIAVHNDAMPNYINDYPDAESIQGNIRWIP